MKILAIGDIHGKDVWKKAISRFTSDVVVFIGDYVIAKRWILNNTIQQNLSNLIEYKKRNFESTQLLIGNHDLLFFQAGPLRRMFSKNIYRVYQDNTNCFRAAYQYHSYLFTHAGVSLPWYQRHQQILKKRESSLGDKLNLIHHNNASGVLYEKGRARGGSLEYGGIIYADKSETENNGIEGYIQVVGHTKVPQIQKNHFTNGSIVYIDCLNSKDEFLYIDNDKMFAVNLADNWRELP